MHLQMYEPDQDQVALVDSCLGAKVTITGESGSWYKIQSGSINGYVSKTYIK